MVEGEAEVEVGAEEVAEEEAVVVAGVKTTTTCMYCFNVILLNPGQSSIPRGSTRSELESNGRVKTLEIPHGATPRTTYERLLSLFPELDGLGLFFAFLFPGICFYLSYF